LSWENVDTHENLNCHVNRLRIPGGWLYSVVTHGKEQIVFVPYASLHADPDEYEEEGDPMLRIARALEATP